MSKEIGTCTECNKPFETFTTSTTRFCGVDCEAGRTLENLNMKSAFIVTRYWAASNDPEVVAVFSSEEAAEEFVRLEQPDAGSFWYEYQEWPVDEE
jgi:hypothetical protein